MNSELIEKYCLNETLSTYDPYDMWKTPLGFNVKMCYNGHKKTGLIPAAILTLYDLYFNISNLGYKKQEYPIVRAQAALCLLNLYKSNGNIDYLSFADKHINWLVNNSCASDKYKGMGWGLGFAWAVDKGMVYPENMPTATMTPYMLEAIIKYEQITGDNKYSHYVAEIAKFFLYDLEVLYEDEESMATSYAPIRDRIVINSCSYNMYSLALALPYVPDAEKDIIESRIVKLFNYIKQSQLDDGAFMYSTDKNSFIDCFHSCFVIKNLIKTQRLCPQIEAEEIIDTGYRYILNNFVDQTGLFRRFTISNKPSLIKYDLYDNAEVINLMLLMGDTETAKRLISICMHSFYRKNHFYSQKDMLGLYHGKDHLRWAVMPFLYALSCYQAN